MDLTILTLPTAKILLPYEISSSLPKDQGVKFVGFTVEQTSGFFGLMRTLKLTYVGLTGTELASFDIFNIQDPYTVFSVQLSRTEPYIIGKPSELSITPRRKLLAGTYSTVFDLTFSARIL